MRSTHKFVGLVWELGTAVWTGEDEDGFPIASHDGLGFDAGGIAGETHHSFGFMAKPLDPERDPNGSLVPGKSCNILIGKIGKETHLWYSYDPRIIPKLPVLKKGGAMFYCAAGSFRVFDDSGTETAYFPVSGGKAHIATSGLDGQGRPIVAFEHCDGMAVTMLEHSLVIKNAAGDCYIELKDGAINVSGNVRHVGALAVDMVTVGAAGTPVVHAPALITLLQSMATALDAALGAVVPPQPPKFVAMVAAAIAGLPTTTFTAT